ncbi:unnamed protein product [Rhizoctonia solani]|uniref:FAD-binding FR-type domain-containing protein n=1 Tax=Rhizoctonia solani TaxID=456999 RepID=A0A8H3CVR3_9AGAM|nr:unnamed protein product [Rhizoctonia solani]
MINAPGPTTLQSMLADDTQPQSHSMLDLLEKYPNIDLPLGVFIASLPSMRLHQYSISSSPLSDLTHVTLTISVVSHSQFLGVASNFLANLQKGDQVQMAVCPLTKVFHPPPDPSVPMVMFAAGSGWQVAKSVLFFGCHNPGEDYLYGDSELKEWTELRVVDVRPAFSCLVEKSGGSKYVQDRIWADRNIVNEAYENGVKFYTCGGSNVASAIRDICIRIIAKDGCGEGEAEEFFKEVQKEHYATDVFG